MTQSRQGNFDLMRLAASFTVLWSHQYVFMGLPEPGVTYAGSLGGVGVFVFFAISGYLNIQSLVRSASLPAFLMRRALRIFPALIVCAAFCVVLGAIVTRVGLHDYFIPADQSPFARDTPFSFFWRNSLLLFGLDFYLPGVFETNILPRAVNGSLWTLPHEVKLYILLAIVALCCGFRTSIMRGLFVGSTLGLVLCGLWRPLLPIWLDHHFLTFGIVFAAGVAVWLVESRFGWRAATTSFVAVALVLAVSGHIETAVLVVTPAVCVMLNAVALPRWMTPRIDISYGVYLYAFPVQQVFAMWTQNFWLATAGAVVVTTFLAFLSAKLVEQPALGLRQRFVRTGANRRNAPSKILDTTVADAEVAAAIVPRT